METALSLRSVTSLYIVFYLSSSVVVMSLLYRYRSICQPLSSLIRKELENICRYPNEPFIIHIPHESVGVCFIADDEVGFAGSVCEVHLNHCYYLLLLIVMSLLYIYRQICQPLCTLIIEFCQSFLERYFCFFLRFAIDGGFIFWYNASGVAQKGSGGSDIIRTC